MTLWYEARPIRSCTPQGSNHILMLQRIKQFSLPITLIRGRGSPIWGGGGGQNFSCTLCVRILSCSPLPEILHPPLKCPIRVHVCIPEPSSTKYGMCRYDHNGRSGGSRGVKLSGTSNLLFRSQYRQQACGPTTNIH